MPSLTCRPRVSSRSNGLGGRSLICCILLGLAATVAAAPPAVDERDPVRIKPWPANPYYWQYKERPIVLLGGSVEDNLFQISELEAQLDRLRDCGGNYIRNTLSSRDGGNVWMFHKRDDGKYDLEQPNDEYYTRLKRLLDLCLERDIIVQYELWDRFDYSMKPWLENPFRPANNINFTVAESGLKNEYPNHPGSNENPFFRTHPAAENNARVLKYQQAHIDRVLAISLPYPNVLYCMDNETGADPTWGAYWSEYLKTKAAEAGVTVQTTEMWDDWNLRGPQHQNTLDHPETYSFVDVSQNNHQKGQEHWDNLQWARGYLSDAPRPINHVKCYGADGGRYGDNRDGTERFWRSLVGGAASIRFHRPDSGLGLSDLAQANIKSARMFADAYDLTRAVPVVAAADLLGEVPPGTANASTIEAEAIAAYLPRGGTVTLSLPEGLAPVSVRWLDIAHSQWVDGPEVNGPEIPLAAPDDGQWLALVQHVGEISRN